MLIMVEDILIDFDLRRPGLHKFVGLENDGGLIPIINKSTEQPNFIRENLDSELHDIHPNLKMLTSGGKTRSVTELIEKNQFHELLAKLKSSADIMWWIVHQWGYSLMQWLYQKLWTM